MTHLNRLVYITPSLMLIEELLILLSYCSCCCLLEKLFQLVLEMVIDIEDVVTKKNKS